ncbi:MAG: nucleotidyltransferase family protein [Anaerolineae bacterium]
MSDKRRREEALRAAEACATLLRERFGARRVVLFGSLAGDLPEHDFSDIDLAVEGLPPEDFFRAYSACWNLMPPGLMLDLVPLESASPELRARILGEVPMPDKPMEALKSLIEDELTALERVVQRMEELLTRHAQETPTWVELYAIAGMLHEFYNGVERIFERLVLGLGEEVPRGASWHPDLLAQVAEPQEGRRPAVVDAALRSRLEEYLRFRHFFRHAYGYTLEWDQLRWLAESLGETFGWLREQIRAFFTAYNTE